MKYHYRGPLDPAFSVLSVSTDHSQDNCSPMPNLEYSMYGLIWFHESYIVIIPQPPDFIFNLYLPKYLFIYFTKCGYRQCTAQNVI